MFVRNLLQAGDYVTLVPQGMLITLQYSEKGTLQKVYRNHDSAARIELSNAVMANLLKHKQVPNKISIQGGTSWVEGVLYTEAFADDPGDLPDCIFDTLLSEYESDPASFTFYAGNVESLAKAFSGALFTRQWLTTSLFKVLPGYLMSGEMSEDGFLSMISHDYPFRFPIVSNYIVFRHNQVLHMSTGLSQCVVDTIQRHVDESGIIRANVTTTEGIVRSVTYSDIMNYQLAPGSCIISSNDGHILYTDSDEEFDEIISGTITCSCCGKKLIVPKQSSTIFTCSDPQCNSVLYPRVSQLFKYFGLDPMSFETYKSISDKIGNIFSIPDIFDLDDYKDVKINISMHKALRAVLPQSVLPHDLQISQLCDACNNSLDTVIYYVQHVDQMKTELGLDPNTFIRLYKWLLNPENSSDVVELLRLKNLTIIASSCEFAGAPIFRNKTIAITGTFKHGSLADIEAIFSSYAAKVTTDYNENVDCVVLGDIQENVKGAIVRGAREAGVPIFQESEFFTKYDIDADMAENL